MSASMKCWWTMPMPAAMASAGLRKCDLAAVEQDRALVGAVLAVEGLHQRRLAGAVLADDGVHLAAADPQLDVAVGDDAGEALGDAAQLHRVRGAAGRAARQRAAAGHSCCGHGGPLPRVRPRVAAHVCSSASVTTGSAVVTGRPGPALGRTDSARRMMSHPGVLLGVRPRDVGRGRHHDGGPGRQCARTRRRVDRGGRGPAGAGPRPEITGWSGPRCHRR